jgi:NADPH2:quinone reductase
MKAVTYDEPGAPGVFRYLDPPDPAYGPNDVLIFVESISIEGGDLINWLLSHPLHPSFVVGYAAARKVATVGANVPDRAVGNRVASFDMQDRMPA